MSAVGRRRFYDENRPGAVFPPSSQECAHSDLARKRSVAAAHSLNGHDTTMTTRLSTVAPDLEDLLLVASPEARKDAAGAVSKLALHHCGVVLPLEAISASDQEAYAAKLDEIYFDLRERNDATTDGAFCAARAASSAAFATMGRCEEAVYEAIIALGDTELVRMLVVSNLDERET